MAIKGQLFFYVIVSFLLFLTSCGSISPEKAKNELRSTGFIRYSIGDKSVVIPDSIIAGDPATLYLWGNYYSRDTRLVLWAGLPYVRSAITITLTPCIDTGTYKLESLTNSSAYFFNDANSYYQSIGTLHLTQFDTIKGLVSGTFTFRGYEQTSNDSILIDSGVFSNFPIIIDR